MEGWVKAGKEEEELQVFNDIVNECNLVKNV